MSLLSYWISSLFATLAGFDLHFHDYMLLVLWLIPTLGYYKYLNRKTRKAWVETARLLGFELQDKWRTFRLEGVHEKGRVLITAERRKSLESWSIRVQQIQTPPLRFTARARSLKAPVQLTAAGPLVLTGDEPFDDAVRIQSKDETSVIAVFSVEIRRKIRALVDGTSTAVAPEGIELFETETKVVKAYAKLALELKDVMSLFPALYVTDSEMVPRLAFNLQKDPVVAVRLSNMSVLLKRFPKAKQTDAAMRAALTDSDPLIRLEAALYLKEESLDRRINDLVTVKSKPYNAGVVADVMDSLSHRGGPAAERALVFWLNDEASSVKLKAVDMLGKIGSPNAVGRLRALESGILGVSELKTAIKKTIGQIQSRVDPSAHGSLSLSDVQGSEGALSLAHDGGELSLEPPSAPVPPKPEESA